MHDLSDLPLIDTAPAAAEEGRRGGNVHRQTWSALGNPVIEGLGRGHAVRNHPLTLSLSQHPDGPPAGINVINIQTTKFTHSDAGRVKQLKHRNIAQSDRPGRPFRRPGRRLTRSRSLTRDREDIAHLFRLEHTGQGLAPS